MTQCSHSQMLQYLTSELNLTENTIKTALDQSGQDPLFLPMILWQCELLSLKQVDQVYDWLAAVKTP